MARLLHFLNQAWSPPADPNTSFEGKTLIVTGANSGLGLEAALKFHALGASLVILAVRDVSKGESAKTEIEARCAREAKGDARGELEVWKCDMDDYASLLEFVGRANALARLDGVVLNAGLFGMRYQEGRYGVEEVVQVHVLSTALLGILLLPKLKASKRVGDRLPVLEFVGSDGYELVTIPEERRETANLLETYSEAERFDSRTQYQSTKLFVMYVMQTLASLAKSGSGEVEVLVLAVCPGGAKSNLSRGYTGLVAEVFKTVFASLFLRTTEQGARTLVSGCLLGEEAQGRFWQSDVLRE